MEWNSSTPIGKFWWLVGFYSCQHPEQGAGQTTFNVLFEVRPDLSEQIRGTVLDAFHERNSTKKLDKMCQWIEENW